MRKSKILEAATGKVNGKAVDQGFGESLRSFWLRKLHIIN